MTAKTKERLLLVGSRLDRKSVEEALRRLKVNIDQREEIINIAEIRSEKLVAVVVVEPSPNNNTNKACSLWSTRLHAIGVPLFPVVSSDINESEVRRLYRTGATAVFEWPREKDILPELLSQMIHLDTTVSQQDESVAFASAIRLRIEADEAGQPGYVKQIRITTSDGIASLKGIVNSLWKKQAIEEIVAETPGV